MARRRWSAPGLDTEGISFDASPPYHRHTAVQGPWLRQPHARPQDRRLHYQRRWRTGHTETVADMRRQRPLRHREGYVLVYLPDHPLTTPGSSGWVYEHRAVAYDARWGRAPTECEWCAEPAATTHPTTSLSRAVRATTSRQSAGDPAHWAQRTAARVVLRHHLTEYELERNRIAGLLGVDARKLDKRRGTAKGMRLEA